MVTRQEYKGFFSIGTINLKAKFLFLLLLPITIIAIFFLQIVSGKNHTITVYENSLAAFHFVLPYSYLISSIANERGKLNNYLNDGKVTKDEINHVFKQTQLDISDLPNLSKNISLHPNSQEILKRLDTELVKLEFLKKKALWNSGDKRLQQQLFNQYSFVNETLISLILMQEREQKTYEVSKLLEQWFERETLKEYLGKERGLRFGLFLTTIVSEEKERQLNSYVYAQKNLKRKINLRGKNILQGLHENKIQQFRDRMANEKQVIFYLNSIRSIIGFEGYIKHFKDYIHFKTAQARLLFYLDYSRLSRLRFIIKNDTRIPLVDREKFADVFEKLGFYQTKIDQVDRLIRQKKTTEEIEEQVLIDSLFKAEDLELLDFELNKINGRNWWKVVSSAMLYMQQGINTTIIQIESSLNDSILKAEQERNIYVAFMLLLLLIVGFVSFLVTKQSVKQLQILTNNIQAIELEEESIALEEPVALDELGKLIYALNNLIRKNRKSVENLVLFEEVFKSINQAVLISDDINNIIFVNKAFEELYGYQLAEIKGKNPRILQSAKTPKGFAGKLWHSLNQYGRFRGITWNKKASGEIFPLDTGMSILKDSNGKIKNYIAVSFDITEQLENEKKVWKQANIDSLTGLYNRQYLRESLKKDLAEVKRNHLFLAVLFIDLDGFKLVNDLQGHDAGDALLKYVANIMVSNVRKVDTVVRLGGDEFVIILTSVQHVSDIKKVASKILETITEPLNIEGKSTSVSGSIGVAVCSQSDKSVSVDTIVQQADTAMYQAKKLGKNRIEFYQKSMHDEIVKMVNVHERLLKAVKNNELRLFYQPVIELSTGKIIGAEALVRWQDSKKGLIFPDEFIPVAEEMGSIIQLGEWVLDESYRQGMAWIKSELFGKDKKFKLNVNLSSKQCLDNFKTILLQLNQISINLKNEKIENFLQIEITESMLFEDSDNLIQQFNKIRDLGFKILIDDFGTGYSSLSYIKKFPVNKLKIDRAFIKDLATDVESKPLVTAIVSMAHALNIEVVAEGVEEVYHGKFLSSLGCEYAQGYFYSKPVPAEQFEQLVLKQLNKG